MTVDDTAPCKRPRDERFCQILSQSARDGHQMTLVQAWCDSAEGYPKPEPSPGLRVSSSKAHKRLAGRVAYLKAEYATKRPTADAVPTDSNKVTAQTIQNLMTTVTESLMKAASAASAHGANNIACQIRKTIVTHSGRINRVSGRVDAPLTEPDNGIVEKLASNIALNLGYCSCTT